MRVYLAGPMSNIKDFNFPAFDKYRDLLTRMGHQVISPADMDRKAGFDGKSPDGSTGNLSEAFIHEAVRRDVQAIICTDATALMPGWEKSRGVAWEKPLTEFLKHKILDATTGLEFAPDYAPAPWLQVKEPDKTFTVDHGTKPSNPKDLVGSTKVPLGLFPTTAIAAGCMAFEEGMVKYGRMNWRAVGVRASIYYEALFRHMFSWWEGEDIDADSGLPHLAKALACIAILIDAKAAGKLTDDRAVKGGYAALMTELTPLVTEIQHRHAMKSPKHYTIADNIEV